MTITSSHPPKKPKTSEHITDLCSVFGKPRVRIHNEFHVTIKSAKGVHDIWFPKNGLKYKLAGTRKVYPCKSIDRVIDAIVSHEQAISSELDEMREAFELATVMVEAKRLGHTAVYVDAGWKDGLAEIGAVYSCRTEHGMSTRAISFFAEAETNVEAERLAVGAGVELAGEDCECPIYTDCQPIVPEMQQFFGERVTWLPRDKNKVADKIARRRGKA